jgi:hypothetical protein
VATLTHLHEANVVAPTLLTRAARRTCATAAARLSRLQLSA